MNVAVVLASSDNTADVGAHIASAIDRHWADCPYPRFVSLTSETYRSMFPGWSLLVAGQPSGWRSELSTCLSQLPPEITYVILLLDDFLFLGSVDTRQLAKVVGSAVAADVAYLRLKPVERALLPKLARYLRRAPPPPGLRLRRDEPYYSSLQAALWRRSHLVTALDAPGSIWDFEHQVTSEAHFATTQAHLLDYRHVVERGKWLPYAARAFYHAGVTFQPGSRAAWGRLYGWRSSLGRLRFAIFGYCGLRLRRWLATRVP